MKSMNRVTLIGHLAADAELRQGKSGKQVVNFPIATNRRVIDSGGEKSSVADYHRVVGFGKLAEISADFLKKGVAAFVEGTLVYRSFDDDSGKKRYQSEIILSSLNVLSPKKEAA